MSETLKSFVLSEVEGHFAAVRAERPSTTRDALRSGRTEIVHG